MPACWRINCPDRQGAHVRPNVRDRKPSVVVWGKSALLAYDHSGPAV